MPFPIAVLISGSGSNLQALIDRIDEGALQATIKVVVSNVEGVKGLKRAHDHHIPVRVLPHSDYPDRQAHDRAIIDILHQSGVQAVCLAGYMRLISKDFVQAFPNRILNIHPSILPGFPGLDAQHQAADYGVRFSGATVHFVDQDLDHGPIIIQGVVPAYAEDAPSELAARILAVEHRIYPQAVQWLAQDRLRIRGRQVTLQPPSTPASPSDWTPSSPCLINPALEQGF